MEDVSTRPPQQLQLEFEEAKWAALLTETLARHSRRVRHCDQDTAATGNRGAHRESIVS